MNNGREDASDQWDQKSSLDGDPDQGTVLTLLVHDPAKLHGSDLYAVTVVALAIPGLQLRSAEAA